MKNYNFLAVAYSLSSVAFYRSSFAFSSNNLLACNRAFYSTSLLNYLDKRYYSTTKISDRKVRIWINWDVFKYKDFDKFKIDLFSTNSNLKFDTLYSLYVKVRYGNNFIMICDKQRGIRFGSINDPSIKILFEDVLDFISNSYENYEWDENFECDCLLLDFWIVEVPEYLKISNIDRLTDVMSKKSIEFVSRDFKLFGDVWAPIKGHILKVSVFGDGDFNILDPLFDSIIFIEKFNKEIKRKNNSYTYNEFSKFYLVDFEARYYVIVYDVIDSNTSTKRCFNINGSLITQVKDILSVDSIVTDLKLPESFVDSKELGKLKLEYIITEAFFITDKTYAFKTIDGVIVKRAKGISSDLLSFDDYEKMFNQEFLNNTIRTSSKRNYAKGSVRIKDDKINLDTTTYNKRSKIYEADVWTETKPIYINDELWPRQPQIKQSIVSNNHKLNKSIGSIESKRQYSTYKSHKLTSLIVSSFNMCMYRKKIYYINLLVGLTRTNVMFGTAKTLYIGLDEPKNSTCLKPIFLVENKLLTPILFTSPHFSIIPYHIQRCELILSKLPDNNKVKQFLIKEFDIPIIVCASNSSTHGEPGSYESRYTYDILEHVDKIENYTIIREDIKFSSSPNYYNMITSKSINDITRNEYSYNETDFLKFNHIFLTSHVQINKLKNDKSENRTSNLSADITHSPFKDILFKNKMDRWTLSDNPTEELLIDTNIYKLNLVDTEYLYDSKYMSCCYIIIFNNKLYYYIGSTTDIMSRVNTHKNNIQNNIKHIFSNYKLSGVHYSTSGIVEHFLNSEILHNYRIDYNILPIYLSTNYLNKYTLLNPSYQLSKGEWIILKYVTDLTIKILEQSLIDKFKPKLNTSEYVGIRPWSWRDSYLDEISHCKSLDKVYGGSSKFLIKQPLTKEAVTMYKELQNKNYSVRFKIIDEGEYSYIAWPPKTISYICKSYNLNIKEILANDNILHNYIGCNLSQPMIIEQID